MSAARHLSAVPSPAVKRFTADALLAEIRARGGRVYLTRTWPSPSDDAPPVFCLTDDPELARWLRLHGAAAAQHASDDGAYRRAGDKQEYDLYVHSIPLEGDKTLAELLA